MLVNSFHRKCNFLQKLNLFVMKKLIPLLFLLIITGCSNDDSFVNTFDDDTINDENPTSQELVLQDNVVAIKDDNSEIVSSESDLANGIYSIEFSETPPEIETNDIIVGSEGSGFIRRVTSVSTNGSIVTMPTTQATLKDIFKSGTIEFTTNPASASKKRSGLKSNQMDKGKESKEEYVFDLSGLDYGPNFKFTKGTASFNPTLSPIVVQYDNSQVREMTFKDNNIVLSSELEFIIESGGPVDYATVINQDEIEIEYVQEILGLEFNLVITIEPVIDFSLFIDDAFKATGGVTNNAEVSLVVENKNATWNNNDSFNVDIRSSSVYMEKPANIQQHYTFIARLSAQVNLLPALYLQADLSEDFHVNYTEESGDWDSELSAGFDFNYGIYGEIFGIEFDLSEPPYNYSKRLWYAPMNLKIESGYDQIGLYFGQNEEKPLDEPLKVKVFDSDGSPLQNAIVHYEVITGGGSVDFPLVPTDASGFAEANWTLGNEIEDQIVEVSIRKANGDLIGDSPLEFKATMIDLSGIWILESTTTNCPEAAYYSFKFNPNNNSIIVLEDAPEIVSTNYYISKPDLELTIGITSKESFKYICEVDDITYITEETGLLSLGGSYSDEEFRGNFNVSFTELPVNPCVYNFSCEGSFIIHR